MLELGEFWILLIYKEKYIIYFDVIQLLQCDRDFWGLNQGLLVYIFILLIG